MSHAAALAADEGQFEPGQCNDLTENRCNTSSVCVSEFLTVSEVAGGIPSLASFSPSLLYPKTTIVNTDNVLASHSMLRMSIGRGVRLPSDDSLPRLPPTT